jgi:RHS repeat-associated protein
MSFEGNNLLQPPNPPTTTNRYQYNGKEWNADNGLNWYDYGARWYDPAVGRWWSVDPIAEKNTFESPYAYTHNNPINYVDPDGLYPRSILIYDAGLGLYGGYKFTKSAAHLLSLVSGVSRMVIDNTIVQERAPGQYRPGYGANRGGGAITMGTGVLNSNITFTKNWFNDDPNSYNGHGYGQNIMAWLALSSHEVGHLAQLEADGGFFNYIGRFIKEYSQYGHDDAPSEQEADKGRLRFWDFDDFVNDKYGYGSIEDLFRSNQREDKKVATITKWWEAYEETQKTQTDAFFKNLFNLPSGTYIWNGKTFIRQ